MNGGVTVSFCGVHAIYHLALAAHEIGKLDRFYCSLFMAPGTWGERLSRVVGRDAMLNRSRPEIPAEKVDEYPWPLLGHMLYTKFVPNKRSDWFATNDRFDRRVARKLRESSSRVFVGMETCSEHSLRAARARGMKTVLDVEQVHPKFLWNLLARAADDLGLPAPGPIDPPEMALRKETEYELADAIIVLSEVEQRSFVEQGFAPERLVQIPLWADTEVWYPPPTPVPTTEGPLRVLYVGSVELRKGIPYLLQAVAKCGPKVELTMVGTKTILMEPFLEKYQGCHRYLSPKTKPQLREMCWRSDVLVLPSLVDTFGLVAMEAMACGLPVIVSENCGVPVPDPSWRVPIMDANALAERLLLYADDRARCRADGLIAERFVRAFHPAVYRRRVGELFTQLL